MIFSFLGASSPAAAGSGLTGQEAIEAAQGGFEVNDISDDKTEITVTNGAVLDWTQGASQAASHSLYWEWFGGGSAKSTVMNLDSSGSATQLMGRQVGVGRVYWANPAGIFIGDTAVFDLGGFMAIAGNVSVDDFNEGHFDDTQLEGFVENHGEIRAKDVMLFGKSVSNTGRIVVDDGMLVMAAGDRIRVGKHGSPIVIELDDPGTGSTGVPDPTQGDYAVENTGYLDAGTGSVQLAAGDLLGLAVANRVDPAGGADSGVIVASDIRIEAGEGSRIDIGGRLDASNARSGKKGGTIEVSADWVSLDGAELDASGAGGGGTIHVGGDYQGGGTLHRSQGTYVSADSTLRADALDEGDGGEVVVWSDGISRVYGDISATGGENGGDGGLVETSGKWLLDVSDTPDVSAAQGSGGTWLLDPYDIEINDIVCTGDPACLDAVIDDQILTVDPFFQQNLDLTIRTVAPTSQVSGAKIAEALLAGATVILSTETFGTPEGDPGTGDITVDSSVLGSIGGVASPTLGQLALFAARNIEIKQSIGSADENLSLNLFFLANQDARSNTGIGEPQQTEGLGEAPAGDTSEGRLVMDAPGVKLVTGGGSVTLEGSTVEIDADIDTDGGSITIRTNGENMAADDAADLDPMTEPMNRIAGVFDTSPAATADDEAIGGSIDIVTSGYQIRRPDGTLDFVGEDLLIRASAQNGTGTTAFTTDGGSIRIQGTNVTLTTDDGTVSGAVSLDSGGGSIDIAAALAAVDEDGNLTNSLADIVAGTGDLDVGLRTDLFTPNQVTLTSDGGAISLSSTGSRLGVFADVDASRTSGPADETDPPPSIALANQAQDGGGSLLVGSNLTAADGTIGIQGGTIVFQDDASVSTDGTEFEGTITVDASGAIRNFGNSSFVARDIRFSAGSGSTGGDIDFSDGSGSPSVSGERIEFAAGNGRDIETAAGGGSVPVALSEVLLGDTQIEMRAPGTKSPNENPTLIVRQDADLDDADLWEKGLGDGAGGKADVTFAPGVTVADLYVILESTDGVLTTSTTSGLDSMSPPLGGFEAIGGAGLAIADDLFVDELTLRVGGELIIDAPTAGRIAHSRELSIVGGAGVVDGGALPNDVDTSITVTDDAVLVASDSLSIWAGANGLGDLVFEDTNGDTFTTMARIEADQISLRAGDGIAIDLEDDMGNALPEQRIEGVEYVEFRRAGGGDFVYDPISDPAAGVKLGLEIRQDDDLVDSQVPDFAAAMGMGPGRFGASVTDLDDIELRLRSDVGLIDLDDPDKLARSNLSLLSADGFEFGGLATPIDADNLEIGGVGSFQVTQALLDSFTLTDSAGQTSQDPTATLTLRAGASGLGNLTFENDLTIAGIQTVRLRAGDGSGSASSVDFDNDRSGGGAPIFDFSGFAYDPMTGAGSTLIVEQDARLQNYGTGRNGFGTNGAFLNESNFAGAGAERADTIVLRSSQRIDLRPITPSSSAATEDTIDAFDLANADAPDAGTSRVVLSAPTIEVARADANDLLVFAAGDASTVELRADSITLSAQNVATDPDPADRNASVRITSGTNPNGLWMSGDDEDFDDLFDPNEDLAAMPVFSNFDHRIRGTAPTELRISQDGAIDADQLPTVYPEGGVSVDPMPRATVQGVYGSARDDVFDNGVDEPDEDRVVTALTLVSNYGDVEIRPENVEGADVVVRAGARQAPEQIDPALDPEANDANVAPDARIWFQETGVSFATAPRTFTMQSFVGDATGDVDVYAHAADNTDAADTTLTIDVEEGFSIQSGRDNRGDLAFNKGGNTTSITADTVTLRAGNGFTFFDEDSTVDINQPGQIDSSGLSITLAESDDDFDDQTALFLLQDASIDPSPMALDPDPLAVIRGSLSGPLGTLDIRSRDGYLELDGTDLADIRSVMPDTLILSSSFIPADPDAPGTVDRGIRIVEDIQDDLDFGDTVFPEGVLLQSALIELIAPTGRVLASNDDLIFDLEDRTDLDDNPDARPKLLIEQMASDFDDGNGSTLPSSRQFTRGLNLADITLRTLDASPLLFKDVGARRLAFSNLTLESAAGVIIEANNVFAASPPDGANMRFNSLVVDADSIVLRALDPTKDPMIDDASDDDTVLRILTLEGQTYKGDVQLQTDVALASASSVGGDIIFEGKIDAEETDEGIEGLTVVYNGRLEFADDIGTNSPLERLDLRANTLAGESAYVAFTKPGDQVVNTQKSISFLTLDPGLINEDIFTKDYATLVDESPERKSSFATVQKEGGNIDFNVGVLDTATAGEFRMGAGERLVVEGDANINVNSTAFGPVDSTGNAYLGDVSALSINVSANDIVFVKRSGQANRDSDGDRRVRDSGVNYVANSMTFTPNAGLGGVLRTEGKGKAPVFGFARLTRGIPGNLIGYPVARADAKPRSLTPSSFAFSRANLSDRRRDLTPRGPSRSDLSDAQAPRVEALPPTDPQDAWLLRRPERLAELAVWPRNTQPADRIGFLEGRGIVDDTGRSHPFASIFEVTEARLLAESAEQAIALHHSLFGLHGERVPVVRRILQETLDAYLETTRAQRVMGFELRRFVKNRPVSLFESYQTLEELDELFRSHRRLGLSPGEYGPIQQAWLEAIQPEGISLEELSEAIHPSRYVRGSDILDIFGN